jgi:hypothetical protein
VHLERRRREIDDPNLGHACRGVERQLDPPVVGDGGVGDLDDEKGVRRPGVAAGVEI